MQHGAVGPSLPPGPQISHVHTLDVAEMQEVCSDMANSIPVVWFGTVGALSRDGREPPLEADPWLFGRGSPTLLTHVRAEDLLRAWAEDGFR